ncbi:MAG: Smr/MutS family protein, partial [Treponema sp.]|nr:Smr/MutS family protein [Treponema sp.]
EVGLQENEISERERLIESERDELRKEEAVFAENGMKISNARDRRNPSNKKSRRRMSNTEALLYARAPEPVQENKAPEKREKIRTDETSSLIFSPGLEVYAGSERRLGTLVQKNRNGTWSVLFGSMKMNVKETQLIPVKKPNIPATASIVIETAGGGEKEERPHFELRLLGMRQDEALKALERQLDLCLIYDFRSFSIVHGKGQGILQQSVQDYLSHYPGVKEFHFANPEDGGTGKTYVTLF